MRRPFVVLPLLFAAPFLLTGCGSDHTSVLTDPRVSSSATASPTPHSTRRSRPHRTPKPARATAPDVHGPLAGFPLDLGYAEENGDDGSPVEITATPATKSFGVCDRTVWDPRHGTTDVIGVEFRGEAEYVRGRTLVLYPDADAATLAVATARGAVAACPDEQDGTGDGTTHTVAGQTLGDQSVVWTDTFYSVHNGEQQHDTGLVVYVLARVGRAVLLGYEYGEGNGSPASRDQTLVRTAWEGQALVDRMRDLAAGASSEG